MRVFNIFVIAFVFFVTSTAFHSSGPTQSYEYEISAVDSKTSLKYTADWESLDSRPLPDWYDDSKFGIFIHWGVFSVPAYGSEWFWWYWQGSNRSDYINFMKKNYPPGFSYADFAPKFTAEFFNPYEWAEIFKSSGAKYVVLTSKHHEGYTLWPSKYSWNWNAMDVGPKRDLVGDLAHAIRNSTDLKFGLYHSLFEWFNPLLIEDSRNNGTTQLFVQQKTLPELFEIVNKYKPSVVWSDGDEGKSPSYWNSKEFLAWLYNESPVKDEVVVNDRWGDGTGCTHGGFFSCADRYNPGTLQRHKWENCLTIDKYSWGYRRNAKVQDFLSTAELINELVSTVSCGGNFLLNVGPTHDGRIDVIFEERLKEIGQWLKVNGQAIYSSKPWLHQNDTVASNVWYTSSGSSVYAVVLYWPTVGHIKLGAPLIGPETKISLIGHSKPIAWVGVKPRGIRIRLPARSAVDSDWAWVLKMENLINSTA